MNSCIKIFFLPDLSEKVSISATFFPGGRSQKSFFDRSFEKSRLFSDFFYNDLSKKIDDWERKQCKQQLGHFYAN